MIDSAPPTILNIIEQIEAKGPRRETRHSPAVLVHHRQGRPAVIRIGNPEINLAYAAVPATLVESSSLDFELVENVFHLPVLVKARHPGTGNQLLVLLVIPRADEEHVIGVNYDAVLKPPDSHQLVLVG